MVNSENSLWILSESYRKLASTADFPEAWCELFKNAMNVTTNNLSWNMNHKPDELSNLNENLLRELIDKSLANASGSDEASRKMILEFFLKRFGYNNYVDAFMEEKKKILKKKSQGNVSYA